MCVGGLGRLEEPSIVGHDGMIMNYCIATAGLWTGWDPDELDDQ